MSLVGVSKDGAVSHDRNLVANMVTSMPASVPRYTSYPTAPHFKADMGPQMMDRLLNGLRSDRAISLYLHIPFCDRLCWFCGCHTKHTRRYEPVRAYVTSLINEIETLGQRLDFKPRLEHVHFGGGSPSILDRQDARRLSFALNEAFILDSNTEVSIEIDPSDVTEETLDGFVELGMSRASIGVQDFDPKVQTAINRPQSFGSTKAVVEALRDRGITSLNIDALYGLPFQSLETVAKTMDQVISLSPDRIALFGYAHVPWLKKHQEMIPQDALPQIRERFEQATLAAQLLQDAGYEPIGIDHFAKPGDAMAKVAGLGELRRNFQGYTTDRCDTLLGLGASSISRFPEGYIQNTVATARYQALADAGQDAAARGYSLTFDDRIRATVIESIMCQFGVDLEGLERQFGYAARPYIAEIKAAVLQDADGLTRIEGKRFFIPEAFRPLTRIVASWFDAHLSSGNVRYSKAV